MARKAREILKARGYSDAELDGIVLLNDPRFCQSLEAEDTQREAVAAENTRIKTDLANTQRWFAEEANPTIQHWQGEVVKTKSELARLQAQLTAEQELGMRRAADPNPGANPANANANASANSNPTDFSQYDQRYLSADTFKTAFGQVPDVAALMYELGEDHRELFNKRLNIRELRTKYATAAQTGFRGSLQDFWAQEYNVGARREEIAEKSRKDHEDKLRREIRQELMSETGNPNTRIPMSSNSPFVRKPVAAGTSGGTNQADGKQPWDAGSVEQRRSARVSRFVQKQQSGAA